MKKLLTWAEIDLRALKHNLQVIRGLAAKSHLGQHPKILAVVKAGAYGHGMSEVTKALHQAGVDIFGVSNVDEGKALRKLGIKKAILLFENPLPEFAKDIVDNHLTPMLCTLELAQALNTQAKKSGVKVDVHIKIDTGMGRLGVWHEDVKEFVSELSELASLRVCGIATHFPAADTNPQFTLNQLRTFQSILHPLSSIFRNNLCIHSANSAGFAFYENHFCNLVRPGLMLYGLYSTDNRRIKLKSVMTVKSRVIFLKRVQPGRSISYGRTFIAPRPMTVATLPVGYSDGYFRCLSNKAAVLIGGKRCPQIGRVTMDQIVVDVSKVKNVKLGQEAVILGRQGKQVITAEEIAQWAGTINYEVACNLGNRVERIYKK